MSSARTAMFITPYFPPDGGGLERYAKHLATRLAGTHDWKIVIVTSGSRRGQDVVTDEGDLRIYRLSYDFKLSNSLFSFSWGRKLRKIIAAEAPAVINAHMPTPGLADVAARVSGPVPFIVTYHTGTMKKGETLVDLLIGAYEKFLLPRVLNRAKTIICSSDFVRDDFLKAYAGKTVTVTPGVDEKLFRPRARPEGLPKIMLFVGNYGPSYRHKGLADAVAVLGALKKSHPDLELHVAGTGKDTFYLELARRLGVARRVKFLGWCDSTSLAEIYTHASVLILPSKNDSFPLVLVDAMACALPVVSTTVGGIPTVIDDGRTGLLVAPGDRRALTKAVDRVLTDPQLAAAFGRAGRAKVLSHLTWTSKALATSNLFEQAAYPHICQVSAYYPPHLGGVENMVKELSQNLAAAGYGVDVITSRTPGASGETPTPPGMRVKRLWGPEILHTPLLPGLLLALLRQPSDTTYHLHVAQAGLPEITLLAAKLRRRPLIAHIHLDIEASGRVGQLILGPYKRVVLRYVLNKADRVIALTVDQAAHLTRKYGLDAAKVVVMPNGVATEFFLPDRRQFHQPLRLLFVGRLAVQKRPERIVEAMQSLPQVHLDVVGEGPDRAKLEALVSEKALTNVTFHGALRGADLRAMYQNSDILVLPSDQEGMPLTLLEAMAAALPVIGSDVVGIRELIQGVGILVDQPSAATFAAAITEITADPQELPRLSQRSRATAEAYSWDHLTGRIRHLYQEVTS